MKNHILHFCESGSTVFGLKGQAIPFPGQQSGRSSVFRLPWLAHPKLASWPKPGQNQPPNVGRLPRAKQNPKQRAGRRRSRVDLNKGDWFLQSRGPFCIAKMKKQCFVFLRMRYTNNGLFC